jgi:predicted glycogen debranching enzyme
MCWPGGLIAGPHSLEVLVHSLVYGPRELASDTAVTCLEWLVTNGIGGFASGTVGGVQARRYHGLLIAALKPPVGRMLMLVKLAERMEVDGAWTDLDASQREGAGIRPRGHEHLESFRLEGTVPVWTWAVGSTRLEKRVWMERNENTTYVQYRLVAAEHGAILALRVLANHRDMHDACEHGEGVAGVEVSGDTLKIVMPGAANALQLTASGATIQPVGHWDRGFHMSLEAERGLEEVEDHLHAADITATLAPGESLTIVATAGPSRTGDPDAEAALARIHSHEHRLIEAWEGAQAGLSDSAPEWIRQLVLAADAFIVKRTLPGAPQGRSVIAGYPWFSDWGRDTMIALPGLTITTGRLAVARTILTTFARYVSDGMLPNYFPDQGEPPEYNTVDAALWFFQAVRAYDDATVDDALLAELFPVLVSICKCYERGTRHGIRVDPQDGLVCAGESGVQLTWMDARVDDWVVTPREGKPVEVNALWYNALTAMARFATRLGKREGEWSDRAARVAASFARFRNPETGCLYDVLDGPQGADAAIRPNQIFALSLPDCPLDESTCRGVVDVCARELVTAIGLRSLAPSHRDYRGSFVGDRRTRDGAYHQGTIWTWLLPHYALALHRVDGDPASAVAVLEPYADLCGAMCVGTLPEVADGDPPHEPRGCFAQAWTVAETLRVWHLLSAKRMSPCSGHSG